ncbi:MAG TPA: hypothetical protein VIV11_12390 [Kofleriaceae bacterium]
MKLSAWLAWFSLVAACDFGDNQSRLGQPDSGRPDSGATGQDGSVIHPTDAAIDSPPVMACTLVPQSGCSGATPACDVNDDGSTSCRAVTSQGTSNSHCMTETACKDGYTCTGDMATARAWCARFCTQDTDCLGIGSRCLIDLENNNGDPLDVTVCTNACDPVTQSGCPTSMGCLPFHAATGDYTDCFYGGAKALGQTCAADSECATGLVCAGPATGATCKKNCIVGAASTCPTGQTCVGYTDAINIGANTYGACN